jgi:hypothetical protein
MNNKEVKKITVPDNVFKLSEKIIGELPSIIEMDYYTYDSLNIILEKNNLIWSEKYFNGSTTIYQKGLVSIDDNQILLYFIKRYDENTYKYFSLSKESSTDSIIYFINNLKKYKTIT